MYGGKGGSVGAAWAQLRPKNEACGSALAQATSNNTRRIAFIVSAVDLACIGLVSRDAIEVMAGGVRNQSKIAIAQEHIYFN